MGNNSGKSNFWSKERDQLCYGTVLEYFMSDNAPLTKEQCERKYFVDILNLNFEEAYDKKLALRWWYANLQKFRKLYEKGKYFEGRKYIYNAVFYNMKIFDIRHIFLFCPYCLRSKNKKEDAFLRQKKIISKIILLMQKINIYLKFAI